MNTVKQHPAIVSRIINDLAEIHLLNREECHSCTLKGFCGITDEERSRFLLPMGDLKAGDTVNLTISASNSFKAVFFGYLLPFFLVLIVLLSSFLSWKNQLLAGILSLLVLIPYYLAIRIFKRYFHKKPLINLVKQ